MWAACPVPNGRTGTSKLKKGARERVDTPLTYPLPQLGEDQALRRPHVNFTRFHRLLLFP